MQRLKIRLDEPEITDLIEAARAVEAEVDGFTSESELQLMEHEMQARIQAYLLRPPVKGLGKDFDTNAGGSAGQGIRNSVSQFMIGMAAIFFGILLWPPFSNEIPVQPMQSSSIRSKGVGLELSCEMRLIETCGGQWRRIHADADTFQVRSERVLIELDCPQPQRLSVSHDWQKEQSFQVHAGRQIIAMNESYPWIQVSQLRSLRLRSELNSWQQSFAVQRVDAKNCQSAGSEGRN